MKKWFGSIIVWCVVFLMIAPVVLAKTILYVPADNRPVSLEYAVDTVQAAGFDVLVPPAGYLAGRSFSGDPENLWQWVFDNAGRADAMVLSADSLIYGGLVDSRTHDFSLNVLEWRLKRFSQLREKNANAKLYVFSTLMRTPQASSGGMEPPYYEKYGRNIFQLTALKDKAAMTGLTATEKKSLQAAEAAVPGEHLADWMDRRDKNLSINSKLIDLTRAGIFDYLIVGRDDTSPLSQSHSESRVLNKMTVDLPASKYSSFPGADQLGMVLLARAYNNLTGQTPVVEVQYATGPGAATIPSYEDQPFGRTVAGHITAAGGVVMAKSQKPDMVLMVNTPLTGITDEAEFFSNVPVITDTTRYFVTVLEQKLAAGKAVAVADIAFANGADNAFMEELSRRSLLDKLSAYSGWNTASNTLGFAIGQGMMAKAMPDQARKRLLAVRYLDDWAYQANIRTELYREVLYPHGASLVYLNEFEPELTAAAEKKMRLFAKQHLWFEPEKIKVAFPWNRMFELHVEVAPD